MSDPVYECFAPSVFPSIFRSFFTELMLFYLVKRSADLFADNSGTEAESGVVAPKEIARVGKLDALIE